jgi:hypothetical protein
MSWNDGRTTTMGGSSFGPNSAIQVGNMYIEYNGQSMSFGRYSRGSTHNVYVLTSL